MNRRVAKPLTAVGIARKLRKAGNLDVHVHFMHRRPTRAFKLVSLTAPGERAIIFVGEPFDNPNRAHLLHHDHDMERP